MTGSAGIDENVKGATHRVGEAFRAQQEAYSPDEERPLGGYVRTMSVYGVLTSGLIAAGRVSGRKLPTSIALGDFALMAIATHRLTRIVAKDAVTSPLRAPFTRYREPAGASEVNEEVRGHGTKHAIGELIECPFCLAVWISTGLVAGSVFAPNLTRLVSTVFSITAVSDALQFGYSALKKTEG